jgi:hypothetical protein
MMFTIDLRERGTLIAQAAAEYTAFSATVFLHVLVKRQA